MSTLVRAISQQLEKLEIQISEGRKNFQHIRFMFSDSNRSTLEKYKFQVLLEEKSLTIHVPEYYGVAPENYRWEIDELGNIYLNKELVEQAKVQVRVAETVTLIAQMIATRIKLEESHA